MPILLSQLLLKPWLYLVALANALVLGLLGILLFLPQGAGGPFTSSHPAQPGPAGISHLVAGANTVSASTSLESPRFSDSSNTGHLPAVNSFVPASSARGTTFADSPVEQSLPSTTSNVEDSSYRAGRQLINTSANAPENYREIQPSGAALLAGASGPTNQKPQDVAIPLAFTTPDDAATPSQQAALERLRSEFASEIGSQGGDPNSLEYARLWRQEQATNDSSFEQQFGTQAFIDAQLAQDHSGAN